MKTMHLFAGAGGGLLADLILGHDPVAAVEWDPYCCAVLRERAAEGWFPNLQVYEGDVRLFNASDWKGRVDLIHAGFPCQDISVAGKRAGVDEGTRSGLYREVLRCADEIRPKFLFLENVSAILSNGLGAVLGDLASRGYDGRWCCIRASDVGAPHQRDRWWCLAYAVSSGKWGDKRESKVKENDLPDGDGTRLTPRTYKESKRQTKCPKGLEYRGIYHENRGGWEIEPDVGRTSDGISFELDGGWHGKTEAGYIQALRHLREGNGAEALRRAIRGLPMFHAEAVLFAYLREYERGGRIPRTVLEGETTPRAILRKMRRNRDVGGASLGRKSLEQYAREYPDALCDLSQLVASRSETPWDSPLWESGVARVTQSSNSRVDQLKALGNAQVPLQAAFAWTLLKGER